MAEYSCPITLVTPGPDVTFNAASGDRLILLTGMCAGLDMAAQRLTIDDKPQTDGAVVFPGFQGAMHVTLGGIVIPTTDTAAGRNALLDSLASALEAIRDADGTLQQTPSGGSLRSLTVRLEIPLATTGDFRKQFTFGLIAANPTWA